MKLFLISILIMSFNITFYACDDTDNNGDTFPDTVPGSRVLEKLLKE